jgi:hypothetical protein
MCPYYSLLIAFCVTVTRDRTTLHAAMRRGRRFEHLVVWNPKCKHFRDKKRLANIEKGNGGLKPQRMLVFHGLGLKRGSYARI